MRTCSRCGETKPLEAFRVRDPRSGRRDTWCADCRRAYAKQHYERNRGYYLEKADRARAELHSQTFEELIAYLREHPCVDCGETDVRVLHFDHVDRATKAAEVSRLVRSNAWERALIEIEKCVVRCANCHKRRTAQQFGYFRLVRMRESAMMTLARE